MPLIKDKTYIFRIYALSAVDDALVFHYVGRTVDPEARLYQHNRWRQDNELPPVEMRILASTDTSVKCSQLERHYISKFLREGHPLTNRNHRAHVCWSGCPAFRRRTSIPTDPLKVSHSVQCEHVSSITQKRCTRKTTRKSHICEKHVSHRFYKKPAKSLAKQAEK